MAYRSWLECIRGCGTRHSIYDVVYRCEVCGGLLDVEHDLEALRDHLSDCLRRSYDEKEAQDGQDGGFLPAVAVKAQG